MKSITVLLAVLLSVYVPAQDTLTILHVNDTHSMLAPLAPRNEDLTGKQGGIARAATIIGMTKMTEKNVLTLHGGDVFVGDLFFNTYYGVAEFQIMNMLGFDAMTLGNHEFDLTPSTLLTAFDSSLAQGGFEVLSANMILEDPGVQPLKKYVKPYTIKTFGNMKVGIFGMTTPTTNYFSLPSPAVIDENIEEIAGQMVTTLMTEGCNVIIMLSHLGMYYDNLIATKVPGINVIIGAHDHIKTVEPQEVINPSGLPTYIVQAGSGYADIGQMKIIFNNGITSLTDIIIPLDETVPEEPSVKDAVDNLIREIEALYGIPFYTAKLTDAAETFNELVNPFADVTNFSTAVGNLVTDAFKEYTKTDIAITPGGSTSQPLYKGPVTAADVFRMIGYGFNFRNGLGYQLTTFKIKGIDLFYALGMCIAMTKMDDELLPQVSGMKYHLTKVDEDSLVLDWITVNDMPLDTGAEYSVTTNIFLSTALQSPLFNIPVSDLVTDSLSEFEVVLAHIQNLGPSISPSTDPRVITPVETEVPEIPKNFDMKQNYPNPFNPETTIEFSLPDKNDVTLKIYNILGSEVATLVNEQLNAGSYKYTWNASGFASGIYFYQISVGKNSITKKLTLLK